MADAPRARRLAVRIREIVAETLEREVKDPRLGLVTITASKLTADLREATLYYTVFGDEDEKADSARALESAKGVLRATVGKRTGIRYTPSLTFLSDDIPEHARNIDDLLAKAREADAEVARVREGKAYAGDENPYVETAEADADDADLDTVGSEGEPDEVHADGAES